MLFIPYGTVENAPRKRFPYVTVALVAINAIVFVAELFVLAAHGQSGLNNLIARYAFVPASLNQTWLQPTLLTAMFLHAGFWHIAGNMLYLLPFGDNVEDRLGHIRYLLFYLGCGIVANLVFALFNLHSTTPLLGASGAIAGVLGGYLALYPRGSQVKGFLWVIILLIRIRLPAILFIGYWFVMQLFNGIASIGNQTVAAGGGVAFMAHVGGFLAGLITAPLLATFSRRHSRGQLGSSEFAEED